VIATDGRRLGVELAGAERGVGPPQRSHRGHLGDGDNVEDAERPDHDPGNEQAPQIEGLSGHPEGLDLLAA
jgi:hypothetical protein